MEKDIKYIKQDFLNIFGIFEITGTYRYVAMYIVESRRRDILKVTLVSQLVSEWVRKWGKGWLIEMLCILRVQNMWMTSLSIRYFGKLIRL